MEACNSAEHFLAITVQLLQLVLDQHGVQWAALLDQFLSKHNQRIDLIRVQHDLLLEHLHGTDTCPLTLHITTNAINHIKLQFHLNSSV